MMSGNYDYGGYPPPQYRRAPAPSGGGGARAAGCLLLLCAWPLMWVVLPVVAAGALAYAGYSVYVYLARLASALGLGSAPYPAWLAPPPGRATGTAEPAYTHYLFGPALADLRHVARTALPAPWQACRNHRFRVLGDTRTGNAAWLSAPFGRLIVMAMFAGVTGGYLAVATLYALQVATVAALTAVVAATGLVLRGADSALRRVKGIRTSCPSCHLRVRRPSYECAAPGCGRRHRDVRPGRHGVVRRRCGCGALLPTLVLAGGGGRMRAHCPHCGEPMSRGVGTVPEIVIPVLGAATTGKTRLMTALVMGLVEGPAGHGARSEFADEQSENAYRGLAGKLRAGVHTWKTIRVKDAPLRAYTLRVSPPRGSPRLLHVFDAPGELVGASELLRELRYIRAARTFLFTLDPLSVDVVWDSLPAADRAGYARLRSDMATDFVFGQLLQNIEGLGVPLAKARLAVALTKDDLVRHCEALEGVGRDSDDIRRWLEGPAGLDGVVRAMRRHFAEVRFFRTSSWLDSGEIDAGVLDLSGWLLAREGLRVHHSP
ncbi:TRAFAC clade GTPase domain-containing protein [Streptosporangium sp. DT93]|uniref:TRAFAC clade GTPase domain-containing protein n=1 Tax=Streptosporangium sp. DT93 TaxID=3393428 RepID=UPI003CEDDB81